MFEKLISIFKGWRNSYRSLPEPITRFYDDRLETCRTNECGKLKAGICTACGCIVSKKTKSLSEVCPENMWSPVIYNISEIEFILLSDVPLFMKNEYAAWNELYKYEPLIGLPWDSVVLEVWNQFLQETESRLESIPQSS